MKISRTVWARYTVAVGSVILATVIRLALDEWLQDAHAFTLYYAAVALVTWYSGPVPALFTLVGGLLAGDWLFLEPRESFGVSDLDGLITYAMFIFTALLIIGFSRACHLAYQHESLQATHALNLQLQRQAEQLSEADRYKDEFLAMLGHELRNPLAGVVSGAQVLKMIGLDQPDAEEMRGVIERQASHMAHLVDDLLDVSRISRGKIQVRKQRCDLVEVVRNVVQAQHTHLNADRLTLNLALPSKPLWVCGDPTRLSQVVTNLMNNAVKFTERGGAITVVVTGSSRGQAATIAIKDTGIGLEPCMLERIFEAFSQAENSVDRSRGGLGLGLALVRGLVEMHGGHVTAHSDGLGHGSEFRVRLPLLQDAILTSGELPKRAIAITAHRVLLIDDRRDAILPMRKMLELLGQEVSVACDGRGGLEKARACAPQIVLCDIGLPDIHGYDLAKQLRAVPGLGSAYLVAVTGHGQEEDRRRAISAGFDYHLTKPVSKEQLETLLAEFPHLPPSADASIACEPLPTTQ